MMTPSRRALRDGADAVSVDAGSVDAGTSPAYNGH
jgi:hypothetical protein